LQQKQLKNKKNQYQKNEKNGSLEFGLLN
jgi:hypothetical protein